MLFIFTFLLSLFIVGATPVPTPETVELESRTTHTGQGTWFHPGLGNCGKTNKDSDMIVAISKARYDSEHGSNCGQWMEITNNSGAKVYALTRDSCPGCGYNDLDMSPAVFKKLAPLSKGVVTVHWHFMAKGWSP
ncbi:RlpA-like double-psi beta-barrel-protein domain-containing protein-containing protein [Flagelloscypha sp. PMI_526]|nr:RlpA-like double-psi beta-barrel-protein domain-containing protein-containing protein [Flagelloscypha sp. PMI_526]